jgi:hypothetical protein
MEGSKGWSEERGKPYYIDRTSCHCQQETFDYHYTPSKFGIAVDSRPQRQRQQEHNRHIRDLIPARGWFDYMPFGVLQKDQSSRAKGMARLSVPHPTLVVYHFRLREDQQVEHNHSRSFGSSFVSSTRIAIRQ